MNAPDNSASFRPALTALLGFFLISAANAFAQQEAGIAEVERVIVTGSNIPTAEETGPNPVDTYRPVDIEKLGIRNANGPDNFSTTAVAQIELDSAVTAISDVGVIGFDQQARRKECFCFIPLPARMKVCAKLIGHYWKLMATTAAKVISVNSPLRRIAPFGSKISQTVEGTMSAKAAP